MLDTMRGIASGFVAKALLIFLVITFGVWGIGDIFRNGSAGYVAKVGGDTITTGEFQRQKSFVEREMQALGIQGMDPNKLDIGIIRQLVQEKLILETTHDMGLYVDSTLLARTLREQPQFKNKDGSFNKEAFQATLRAQRLSEAGFIDELKREAAGKFLLASIAMDDVVPPQAVQTLAASSGDETRDALLVTITPRSAATPITDAMLKQYYDKNANLLYLQPESRTVEYATIDPASVAALVDASITPDMLADRATEQPNTPKDKLKDALRAEQRDSVLRALSNKVEDALAAGGTMADALAKAGLKAQPHTLANVTADSAKAEKDEVLHAAAAQGAALGEGEISNLITTPHGTMLMVSVKTVAPATPKKFDAVKADVHTRLAEELSHDATKAKAQEVKAALGKASLTKNPNWAAVLGQFQLAGRSADNLTRPVEGKPATNGIPPLIQQAIFERPVGQVAGPLALENGDQFLAIVTASHHTKPDFTAKANDKTTKQLATELNNDVQQRAFTYYAEKHPVKVNPAVLAPGADNGE